MQDKGIEVDSVPSLTFSLILPTYNERGNIGPLVEAIFRTSAKNAEVIVVDDDSPDGTWAAVEEMAQTHPDLRLLRRKGKRSLVSALREGIEFSTGEVLGWLDSDLSMPPQRIKDLYAGIEEGYDIVIGSRFVEGGGVEIITGSADSLLAYLLSLFLNRFAQMVLGSEVKDYTSGFIVVKRKILDEIGLKGDYGEYFIHLVYSARRRGYKILEIPYVSLARRKGASKTGTHLFHYLRRGIKYVWFTLKLKMIK